jgi:peroxiredoxin
MIKVGDSLPDLKLTQATETGPTQVTTGDIFAGRKVVLFAVPGAFTPTCSAKHMPGFIEHYDALRAKGVDAVACIAVNDAFVMQAWAKDQKVDGRIIMLADGSAEFTGALGLQLDLVSRGLGIRSQRYALVAEDGKVTFLGIEEGGSFESSRAEDVLAAL